MQRAVEKLNMFAEVEKFIGLIGLLKHPIVVVAIKNANVGLHVGAFQGRGEEFHFVSELGDFLVNAAIVAAIMSNDSAVEFFRAEARLPPAEKQDGGGATRNQLVGKHPQNAGTHERIDFLPRDVARFLFHDPKTAIAIRCADVVFLERAQHVVFASQLRGACFERGGAFDRDEINDFRQIEMIETMKQRPQVGRYRAFWGGFMQNIGLHFDELNDGITAEAAPIENERGVMNRGRGHRHRHFIPCGNQLAPVAQAHEFVQAIDGFVFGFEPHVPVPPGIIVEGGFGEITAEAVVDLPGNQRRMFSQTAGHVLDDFFGVIPEGIAVKTDGAACAFVFFQAALVDGKDFGMLVCKPNGRGGGRGGQDDFNAGLVKDVHGAFEP